MAKITIQKKEKINYHDELSKKLDFPAFKTDYPVRTIEAWRRFDPASILAPMFEYAQKGTGFSILKSAEPESNLQFKSVADWKKEDEVFLKKVQQRVSEIGSLAENNFFEKLIENKAGDKNTFILRAKKGGFSETLSQVNIIPENNEVLNFYSLIIYCDEGSEINLNILKNSAAVDIGSIYIYQEKNSHVKIKFLNENYNKSTGVDYLKSFQNKNSTAEIGIFSTLVQQNKKIFIENNLMEYAQVKYSGLFNGKYSHVDHDFHILHNGSYSKSDVLFKMAVLDESYGIFWGDTRIIPGTAGCEGYQQNKNMVLGTNARIDAIPRLEIETENVIAAHGSATGEISDDEIFYMMSRGLSHEDARKLLLRGFFEDVLRQSFGHDPDVSDIFLEKIWSNIQKILGMDISI